MSSSSSTYQPEMSTGASVGFTSSTQSSGIPPSETTSLITTPAATGSTGPSGASGSSVSLGGVQSFASPRVIGFSVSI